MTQYEIICISDDSLDKLKQLWAFTANFQINLLNNFSLHNFTKNRFDMALHFSFLFSHNFCWLKLWFSDIQIWWMCLERVCVYRGLYANNAEFCAMGCTENRRLKNFSVCCCDGAANWRCQRTVDVVGTVGYGERRKQVECARVDSSASHRRMRWRELNLFRSLLSVSLWEGRVLWLTRLPDRILLDIFLYRTLKWRHSAQIQW